MADKKISELPLATTPLAGTEEQEIVQGGVNKRVAVSEVGGGGSDYTRDLGRTFSAEDIFSHNEIDYDEETLTGDIEFTIAASGHLVGQFCVSIRRIVTDGTHTFTWTGFDSTSDIPNGEIPAAGTYQIFHFYRNGITTASFHPATSSGGNLQTIDVTNGATGSTNLDCLGRDVVKFRYTVTVTGNITITKSADSNLEILNLIIPITGSGITITLPSDVRMARYQESIIWDQSTKVLTVSSIGAADLHELSLNRAGSVFILRYDGPVRA